MALVNRRFYFHARVARRPRVAVGVGLVMAMTVSGLVLAAPAQGSPGQDGEMPEVPDYVLPANEFDNPGEPKGGAPAEAEALAEAVRTGEPVEVLAASTETLTVVANPDGTVSETLTQAPVRVADESGLRLTSR